MAERPFNHYGFNAYLSEQRLMGARCRDCGQVFVPPRAMCPNCYSTNLDWVELSGEGTLAGYTIVFVGLPAFTSEGYSRETPYVSGIVRLAEGPAISGQILVDGLHPEAIQIGMPVRVTYVERPHTQTSGADEEPRFYLAFERIETT